MHVNAQKQVFIFLERKIKRKQTKRKILQSINNNNKCKKNTMLVSGSV